MNIVSVGNFGTGWDGSICDEEHIAAALEQLGHKVYRLQRGSGEQFSEADFTLIAQWDGYSEEFLRSLPRPIVYWAFDYQADGQAWHEKLVETADLYLSKRIADSKYPNWRWLSQDFAPGFLDRKYDKQPEQDIDVLFTGSYLPWATELIDTLKAVDEKYNLVVHSVTPKEWSDIGIKDSRGPVMDHGLPELYARAKIVLSIDHTIEAGYWSDRNAQIMACHGFCMFWYVPMSEVHFANTVEYFYDIEDCLKKVQYHLANLAHRNYYALMGWRLARERLMVINRAMDLMTIVESIL